MKKKAFGALAIEPVKKVQTDHKINPKWLRFRTIFFYIILFPVSVIAGGVVGVSSNWLATDNDLVKSCW